MMKFLVLVFIAIIAAVMAAPQPQEPEATCSPWLGLCHTHSDCCRHLECLGYAAKCVPKGGLIIPGQDTRPVGPPPYPPART